MKFLRIQILGRFCTRSQFCFRSRKAKRNPPTVHELRHLIFHLRSAGIRLWSWHVAVQCRAATPKISATLGYLGNRNIFKNLKVLPYGGSNTGLAGFRIFLSQPDQSLALVAARPEPVFHPAPGYGFGFQKYTGTVPYNVRGRGKCQSKKKCSLSGACTGFFQGGGRRLVATPELDMKF